ncbi:MAG: lamin tail domain-containing protein, partial [Bacteroidales bacterium]|nr:lamin tail domain-containing protein [Bacteroidales bacterium]
SDLSDGTFNFRTTFYDVDYIGTTIPSNVNLTVLPNSRTDGNYITARNLADFELTGLPTITKAFALSATEVDVYYNIAPPSVASGDYYITGTSTISFTTATVDGADPKLIHLSGGSPGMASDLTIDELFDDAYGSSYVFYAGISPIAFTNTTNPGGTMLDDYYATFTGIVSAIEGSNVWVSDAAGAYNGILIYDGAFSAAVTQGDEIILAAKRSPFNNLSELTNPSLISTISTGATPYGPSDINASDIEYTIPADTDPAESWEGQLVKITDFTVDSLSVVSPNYACSWSDADVDYTFYIGDNAGSFNLIVGTTYASVTGLVDWYWSGPYYRINPRNQGDIVINSNPATQLAIISVNGGADPYVSTDFDVVVQAQDALGDPAYVSSDVNFTFTTNGGDIGNVVFVTGTTTTGTIFEATSEIIISGVQMAPDGTYVTITATDNSFPFGLNSGTSVAFDVIEFIMPDITITEIMQNPTTPSDVGEWFEVYNNSDGAIDLINWVIKDNDSDSITITESVIVPAGGFAVLGRDSDPLTNGGYTCDYEYSNFYLANGDDEIVLALSDGITEVDRVEYDGGPIWPNPNGASMVYTGIASEDNNVGEIWAEAVLVENSYTNPAGDFGSPGTNGNDQVLTEGFSLDLKVLLEGFYNPATDSMNNYFRQNNLLPLLQPFGTASPYYGNNTPVWEYNGTETSPYIPYSTTTDWILVELRDETYAKAGTGTNIPAFVEVDGQVCSYNGSSRISVKDVFTNSLYIVVYHMNHLSIMSATGLNPVEGTVVSYDFSTGSDKVYGGSIDGYKELETGVWGMVAGDINADGVIDQLDNTDGWSTETGEAGGYQGSNLLTDDQVDNKDKNEYWAPNNGISSQVPN